MDRSIIVRNYVDMLNCMDKYGSYDYTEKSKLYAAEARDPSIGHEARAKYRKLLRGRGKIMWRNSPGHQTMYLKR